MALPFFYTNEYVSGKQLLTLDEAEITARSRELATAVWQRFEKLSVIDG